MKPPQVPQSLRRTAVEASGWIELGCPAHALTKLEPLLTNPGARPFGLKLRATAYVELQQYDDALDTLDELRHVEEDLAWLDLTEAWCKKRTGDLDGAIVCMERLVERNRASAIGHYNLGCYLSLRGDDPDRAIDEVTYGCGLDDQLRRMLADETDLDAIRADPRFRELLPRR